MFLKSSVLFRGIAYQKINKYTAALQDFEKAHKLSPATYEYSNALEKAGKDMNKLMKKYN